MSCCTVYSNPFYKDIKDLEAVSTDLSNFSKLDNILKIIRDNLNPFEPAISGIWFPVVINTEDISVDYLNIFRRATLDTSFNPCDCSPINSDLTPFEEQVLDCDYCNLVAPINNTKVWSISSENGVGSTYESITSTFCSGANDVRMYPDDYLTKLPSLSNIFLTGTYDFKYLDEFPAASNPGLGIEELISIPINESNFFSLSSSDELKLCVDWKLQESIGEVPPDNIDSYYTYIDDHKKAYDRYLTNNKTCGNFILLTPNISYNNKPYPKYVWLDNAIGKISNDDLTDTQLPSVDNFTIPYGFKNQDHYNIFSSGNNKIGSYWKWNYTSGILCWYRHADIDLPEDKDKRLIPGIDLYIPPGDVFYAKNHGPEPTPKTEEEAEIQPCPSGIKLIAPDKTVSGVIPNESEFVYISQNIYSKVRSIFYKIHNLESDLDIPEKERKTPKQKLELACLLGTSPNYDEITIDMLLKDPIRTEYYRNEYSRIDIFNKQMLRKNIDRAANSINIIKSKKDLLNTLVHKYGCYILFPQNTKKQLNIGGVNNSNIVFDLDFEPVVPKNKLARDSDAAGKKDCNDQTLTNNFYYDQTIGIGNSILQTKQAAGFFNQTCLSGSFTTTSAANTASLYFSDALLDTVSYSTGSISLENIYLRPVSYNLALKLVGESICSSNQYSLCNKSLAVKYNNENDLWGTELEKKEGEFRDDSVKLSRGYASSFFNPNINLCAFHRDGGVYYDSNMFGNDKLYFSKAIDSSADIPYIIFDNKDVGIKLYSLKIDKLRDINNPECKTLPLNHACKCFDLHKVAGYEYNCDTSTRVFTNRESILYTPNLSTKKSPLIKSYGDYTLEEITNIFDHPLTIPKHPTYGSDLPTVNKIIDPLNPYECYKTITFNLPNYIYTKWDLGLDTYRTDHADVWVKVLQSNILFEPFRLVDEDDNYSIITDPNYRRYINEVKFDNNLTLYDKQTNVLFNSSSSIPTRFSIEITNPFLYALLATHSEDIEKHKKLYAPFSCYADQNYKYSSTDLYKDNITLTFEQIPRKHLLMYKMYPIESMGVIFPTFFHPNSGIRDEWFDYGTSLVLNKDKCSQDFLYEQELFLGGLIPYNQLGRMYRGIITKENQHVLDAIDKLDSHKKLRLYLRNGLTWYEYINPHFLGFYNEQNNNIYPGMAAYFEYTNFDKPKALLDSALSLPPKNNIEPAPVITKPSTLIPASAKVNTKFTYISNIDRWDKGVYFKRNKDNPKSIILESIRPYFLFHEKLTYLEINSIEELNAPDTANIGEGSVVLDKNNNYWKYHDGPKNDKHSYELLSEPNFYDKKFSNLHFDSSIRTTVNNRGKIVYDSITETDKTDILLYDIEDPTFETFKKHKVTSKYILANVVDEYGNIVDEQQPITSRRYIQIQTVLTLDLCSECSVEYNEGLMALQPDAFTPITIYQNLDRSLYGEFSPLLSNKKIPYQTKWGDLLNYDFDKNFDLNNSDTINTIINMQYPSGLYKNIFDSILINQTQINNHKSLLTIGKFTDPERQETVTEFIENNQEINYVIHQKYNIGSLENYYETLTYQYENFIPLFDLYFENHESTELYRITHNHNDKNIRTSGHIHISGVRGFTNSGLLRVNPKDFSYFILSLDQEAEVKPVLFDKTFYHHTLRVDDIYFPLIKNELVDETMLVSDCNSLVQNFIAHDNFFDGLLHFNTNGFDSLNNNISRPYFQTPVYCDSNIPDEPCDVKSCRYRSAGQKQLKAEYQHITNIPTKFKDLNPLEYAFGIDEGLYNFTHSHNKNIPYITRFEIPPEDSMFNELSDPYDRSQYTNWTQWTNVKRNIDPKYSYINDKYQKKLLEYIDVPQSTLVSDTDILANEMLFRSIYGSKQYINIDTIKKKTIEESLAANYSSNPWSYLLQYTDIKTTPDKIYSLIPYDYDKNADHSRRKVSGSITIHGVASIGKTFSVNINNKTIYFSIQREEGNVNLVASVGSDEAKIKLGDTHITSEYLIAAQLGENGQPLFAPQPPDENTIIERIDTCEGETIKTWSINSYYTKMSYVKIQDDEEITVDLVEEYKRCVAGLQLGICNSEAIPPGIDPAVISYYGIAGAPCPQLCPTCNSRGYVETVNVAPNCQIVASTVQAINYNGLSRGTYSVGNDEVAIGAGCPPRQAGGISLSPSLYVGDFDDFAGGVPVLEMTAARSCTPKSEPCKPEFCHSIEASDKFGTVFEPKRAFIFGTSSPCECRSFSFGYCTPGQVSCNECLPYEPGYPKIFDYSFEQGYNIFTTKGHVLRNKAGDPIVHNGKTIDPIVCTQEIGLSTPGNESRHKASERCFWTMCTSKNESYAVYKSVTKTPTEYEPLCPTQLVTITYDNNTTTINLNGGTNGTNSLCVDNIIRNECPLIEITLPDNTFYFSDTINSECSMCDVEPNKINMPSQNTEWDIITEERTAILGIISFGTDLNTDVASGRGAVWAFRTTCGDFSNPLCCWDGCYVAEAASQYQCGKSAPDSWVWSYALNCELNGSPEPSFAPCIHEWIPSQGTGFSVLVNVKNRITFENTSSNKAVAYAHEEYWKDRMTTAYLNTQACKNNNNIINVEDIVEGVVPGSCSDLKFTKISFPATAFRQTVDGGESTPVSYVVDVAYYTYKYRRPRNIQDVLLGDELATKCQIINPINATEFSPISAKNMVEKFEVKTKNCQTIPMCYDTLIEKCDEGNNCCKVNKIDAE